jgi:uracil-DNA glycosylase
VAHPTAPTLESELRAIDAWWREAGVDQAFVDEPTNWLADPVEADAAVEPAAAAPVPIDAPPKLLAGGPESWPTALEAFDAWWVAEAALGLGTRQRVPARGPAHAALMVLVEQPEAEDAATLLSGPQGALLANMLAAFGIAPDAARIAALLPSHLPHPDWPALERAGWGALARHHLRLAAPRRLLVFGQVALPLLGHDPAQPAADFNQVALEGGGGVPALCVSDLDALLHRPRSKARLWQRWLEWTDGD